MASVHDPTAPLFPSVQCQQLSKEAYLHLAAQWRDLILAREKGADYAAERHMQVCWVLEQAGYLLDDSAVVIALGKLRSTRGSSLCTCNKYLSSIKSFSRWLARPSARFIQFDPLAEVRKFNPKKDRRHERTSFYPVLEKLLATTAASTRTYRGIAGVDRAELYHAAACTGLREGTLVLLEVGQFIFAPKPAADAVAFVKVRADQLKDGDDLIVPIQPDSASRINAYLAGKMPNLRAFRTPPHDYDFARMLRKDLAEAGIPYCRKVTLANGRTRREQVLDFHALRHTFGSWCAAANVPLTTTQQWMGHSSPELTANLYTHVIPADQLAAVLRLPPLPGVKRSG